MVCKALKEYRFLQLRQLLRHLIVGTGGKNTDKAN